MPCIYFLNHARQLLLLWNHDHWSRSTGNKHRCQALSDDALTQIVIYLAAASSLDSVTAKASLTRRPSSSLNPTSSAEASARLLFDSPVDLASSRSVERRCSRALSSLARCLVRYGVVRWRRQHTVKGADEEKGVTLGLVVVCTNTARARQLGYGGSAC